MNYIQPFIWMFKTEKFAQHFWLLILTSIICFILLFVLFLFPISLFFNDSHINFISPLIVLILIFILAGYFWSLTENIINRKDDIEVSNIYDGKLRLKHIIELPEWNIFRFLWRGIASFIATFILVIPIFCLYIKLVNELPFISNFWGFTQQQSDLILYSILAFFVIILPGLLWNYARRDSVFAVFNIPKALYIFEYYTKKYIYNVVIYIIFLIIQFYFVKSIISAIGIDVMLSYSNNSLYSNILSGYGAMPEVFILLALNIVFYIYSIFVGAFLLGTITPASEY